MKIEDMSIEQLRDEVDHWRGNAAATLDTAVTLARAAIRDGKLDEGSRIIVSTINPQRAALSDALAGEYHEHCESCGLPLLAGQPVVRDAECGDIHAACVGASEAEIAAGEMWVDPGSLDQSEGVPAVNEAGKARLQIFARYEHYAPDQVAKSLAAASAFLKEERD